MLVDTLRVFAFVIYALWESDLGQEVMSVSGWEFLLFAGASILLLRLTLGGLVKGQWSRCPPEKRLCWLLVTLAVTNHSELNLESPTGGPDAEKHGQLCGLWKEPGTRGVSRVPGTPEPPALNFVQVWPPALFKLLSLAARPSVLVLSPLK